MGSEQKAWDSLRPAKACAWEETKDQVSLLVPRFGRGRVGRLMDRTFRLRPYRVRLDRTGTFVWRRLDGATSVAEIARDLREAFGDEVEPAEGRLVLFLQQMLRGGFIEK